MTLSIPDWQHVDKRFLFAVAQRPFLTGDHRFCSLVPLLDDELLPVHLNDFPNCGLVWWLVYDVYESFADPGRLLFGTLQQAREFNASDPSKMAYQVDPRSVALPKSDELLEIAEAGDQRAAEAHQLNGLVLKAVDHAPTSKALLRWREGLVGPVELRHEPSNNGPSKVVVRVGREVPFLEQQPTSTFWESNVLEVKARISESERSPVHSNATRETRYTLIPSSGLRRLMSEDRQILDATGPRDRIVQLAKSALTRKRRQKLTELLEETIESGDEELSGHTDAQELLSHLRKEDSLTAEIARSLFRSGILDEQLEPEIRQRVEEWKQERAAVLEAEISSNIVVKEERLVHLEQRERELEKKLSEQERSRREELERGLEQRRAEVESELEVREARIEEKESELQSRQEELRKRLEFLIERYTTERDSVVNDVVSLLPFIQGPLASGGGTSSQPKQSHAQIPEPSPEQRQELELPPFVRRHTSRPEPELTEQHFFDRFQREAERRSLHYRERDLKRFHLAVKTSELAILGGPSGTGKSSLVEVYAHALGGADRDARFLQVWVNPTWQDPSDLLGRANLLDRVFEPGECGLARQLVYALEEEKHGGIQSGVHLVSLDEMNLAHVEHYFGAVLQALPSQSRELPLFDPSSINTGSPWAPYSRIKLSRALRFVGTVNFDETTRSLSLRVLDRAHLIELGSVLNPSGALGSAPEEAGDGAYVSAELFQEWSRPRDPFPSDLASILDQLGPALLALDCPISPRRRNSIVAYVRGRGPLCNARDAFDWALAQRVVPPIRGLFTNRSFEQLEKLQEVVESEGLTETRASIERVRRREAPHVDVNLGGFDAS